MLNEAWTMGNWVRGRIIVKSRAINKSRRRQKGMYVFVAPNRSKLKVPKSELLYMMTFMQASPSSI